MIGRHGRILSPLDSLECHGGGIVSIIGVSGRNSPHQLVSDGRNIVSLSLVSVGGIVSSHHWGLIVYTCVHGGDWNT
ncbi:unnamed protein product [Staurois parvus]|uniref:Uncharacterized protein n=1 Tax=Staurois parvus TaxID=386267 RepID=A0ABN9H3U5_9NEOB|nr:unnamed protein product [Staurois parvus]